MTKCLNQLTLKDIVVKNFREVFKDKVEREGAFEPEYEKFGNTWVKSGEYLDEEEANRLTDELKEELSEIGNMSQFVIDHLAEDDDFLEKLKEILEEEFQ